MGKRQGFDGQDGRLSQEAVETGAQRMGGEFRVQVAAQVTKALGMVDLNAKLFGQLAGDGFDDLAGPIEDTAHGRRHWLESIAARQGEQAGAIFGQASSTRT